MKATDEESLDRVQEDVTNLLRDVPLLNRIFLEAGEGEFRFIRNSGISFGFLIGCVQATTRPPSAQPASNRYCGICVLLPHPVSPTMTTVR